MASLAELKGLGTTSKPFGAPQTGTQGGFTLGQIKGGTTTPSVAQPKQDGWFKSTVKDMAQPFGKFAVNTIKVGQAIIPGGATGDPTKKLNEEDGIFKREKGKGTLTGWLGDIKPFGTTGSFGNRVKESLGVGLELSSYIPFTGGAIGATRAGLKGAIGQGMKVGAIEGSIGGALYGGGREMQNPDSTILSTLGETAKWGAVGLASGVTLGAILPIPLATYRVLRNKPGNKIAVNTMNRVIRLNPLDAQKFERFAQESVGDYAVRRGIYGDGEQILEQLVTRWKNSMDVADATFEKLSTRVAPNGATLPIKYQAEPIQTALTELVEREARVSAPGAVSRDAVRVNELFNNFQNGGLTMKEINEVKRLYERNVKLEYIKARAGEPVVRATNIDTALRDWQQKQARGLGFDNLKEINKETMLAKQLADAFGKTMRREGMNNRISLTDWIILSGGDPQAIAGFITKRFFQQRGVQSAVARKLGGDTIVPPPSAYLRQPSSPQLLLPSPIWGNPPVRQSGVSVMPAKKTFGVDPATGKFKRVFTSEPATAGGQTSSQQLLPEQIEPMLPSPNDDMLPTSAQSFSKYIKGIAGGQWSDDTARKVASELGPKEIDVIESFIDAVDGSIDGVDIKPILKSGRDLARFAKIPSKSTDDLSSKFKAIFDAYRKDVGSATPRRLRVKSESFSPGAVPKTARVLEEGVDQARNVEQVMSSRLMPTRTRVGTTGRYIGSPGIHSPQKLTALVKRLKGLAEKGETVAQWYRKSADEIVREFGKEDAIKFLKLVAVYSNKTTPAQNYEMALRAFLQYKAGEPIKGGAMGFMDRKAEAILRQGADWEGIKTNSFYQNMLKYVDPENADANAVTNDLWMMRAFGYGKKESGMSDQQHVFMTRTIQKIAKETGQSPDEVQAAIWVAMRAGESKTVKSIAEDAEGFAGVARKLFTGVSWEAAPSKSSGLFPEMFSAPWEQRMEYHARIERRFFDDNGNNIILDLVGLPQGQTLRAPGVWEGQVSPGTQFLVGVPRQTGNPYKIDPTAYKKLQLASAIMGKLTNQDGVGFGTMYVAKRLKDADAGVINLGRVLTEQESIALDKAMTERFGAGSYAIVAEPRGARIIHFTDFTPDKFRASLREAVDVTWKGDMPVDIKYGVKDGELVASKPHDYGANYRELIEGWRPGSRERVLLQSIEDGIESDIREFSRKYGWTDGRKPGNEWDYPIGGDGRVAQTKSVTQSVMPQKKIAQPTSAIPKSFGKNDKVLLTDKATGKTQERFVVKNENGVLAVADAVSGIPYKVDADKWSVKLVSKGDPSVKRPGEGMTFGEINRMEAEEELLKNKKVDKMLEQIGFGISEKSDVAKVYVPKQLAEKVNYKGDVSVRNNNSEVVIYGKPIKINHLEKRLFDEHGLTIVKDYERTYYRNRTTGEITNKKKNKQSALGQFSKSHPVTGKPYIRLTQADFRKVVPEDKTVAAAFQTTFHEFGHGVHRILIGDKHINRFNTVVKQETKKLAYERLERALKPTIDKFKLKPEHVKMLAENRDVKLIDVSPEFTDGGYIPGQGHKIQYYNGPSEIFAESYSMYRTNPEYLQKLSPDMYNFIDDLIKEL